MVDPVSVNVALWFESACSIRFSRKLSICILSRLHRHGDRELFTGLLSGLVHLINRRAVERVIPL